MIRFLQTTAIIALFIMTADFVFAVSAKTEVRYPGEFKAVGTSGGVVILPTGFKTRETGTFVNAVVAGVARHTTRRGAAAVQLELKDGRTLTTSAGKLIKMDGVVYKAAGWNDGAFVLVSQNSSKHLRFVGP